MRVRKEAHKIKGVEMKKEGNAVLVAWNYWYILVCSQLSPRHYTALILLLLVNCFLVHRPKPPALLDLYCSVWFMSSHQLMQRNDEMMRYKTHRSIPFWFFWTIRLRVYLAATSIGCSRFRSTIQFIARNWVSNALIHMHVRREVHMPCPKAQSCAGSTVSDVSVLSVDRCGDVRTTIFCCQARRSGYRRNAFSVVAVSHWRLNYKLNHSAVLRIFGLSLLGGDGP